MAHEHDTAPTPYLAVDDLGVDYGGGEVVRGIGLSVARGEVVTLLGPNGAGKTSTLLATIGLVRRARGSVLVDGHPLGALSAETAARRGVILVPDDRGLFSKMSVADHLWLGAHHRPTKDELDRTFDLFPRLANRRGQNAASLSGGEAQMLSIAMALLGRPKILLIDELSMGLAPNIVSQLLALCRRLAEEEDIGVLLVEQFVDLALRTADRAIVLSSGRIVLEGPAAELLQRREELHTAYLGAPAVVAGG